MIYLQEEGLEMLSVYCILWEYQLPVSEHTLQNRISEEYEEEQQLVWGLNTRSLHYWNFGVSEKTAKDSSEQCEHKIEQETYGI